MTSLDRHHMRAFGRTVIEFPTSRPTGRIGICLMTLCALLIPTVAEAEPGTLDSVTSEVYQTEGSVRDITSRGETCISLHLKPGVVDAPLIISRDLDGGVIVARSVIEYGSFVPSLIRSTFSFEAKEGRFRIQQTKLEEFSQTLRRWYPIYKKSRGHWTGVERSLTVSATVVAQCVISGPKREDW